MDMEQKQQPKTGSNPYIWGVAKALIAIIALVGAFMVGSLTGYTRADYACNWSKNYLANFTGLATPPLPPPSVIGGILDNDRDLNAFGVYGSVVGIHFATSGVSGNLIVSGSDGVERLSQVSPQTIILSNRQRIPLDSVKSGDNVVIIGSPTPTGQIKANFIRVYY
ncbi:hypothetical protein M1534_00280 [Patescibacteria group bacterium]|nr:hypothetical protein [Patescibacteria group bacterium]